MIRIWLLISALVLGACDESVDVVLGTERAYTVYGHLSVRSDTQAVRVYAIDQTIDVVRPNRLDARVISRNLHTGEVYTWTDSVIQFGDHNFGHVFWVRFRPDFEERHRLELMRSDGAMSAVEVQIPPESIPELVNPVITPGFVHLPILWQNAPRLNNIRVRYHTNRGIFTIEYPNDQERTEDGQVATVLVYVDVRQVFREIFRANGSTSDARLRAIEQIVLVSSADWIPPGDVFSSDVLIEPGTFSNVENGFGYVGAGYEASFYYEVPDSVAVAAGFSIR